jgi:hypothetical protein
MKPLISHRKAIGLLLCCLLVALSSSLAQTNWNEKWEHDLGEPWYLNYEHYTREYVKAAQVKWRDIATENKGSQADEWAGSYSLDSGFDVSLYHLRWSPQAGFVDVYVYTCLPELRYLNYGSVTVSPTTVRMLQEYPATPNKAIEQAKMYLKVKWGDRHYLIEENRIAEFCDTIAGVGIYKEGVIDTGFWVKIDDEEKSPEGMPILPPEYKHLLKKPIDAKVIAVGKSYVERDDEVDCMTRTVTPVTLNVGSKDGVKAGIAFKVLSPKDVDHGYIKVVTVSLNSSSALFIPHGFEMCDESEAPPDEEQAKAEVKEPAVAVGWKLTTRPADQ